MIGILGTIAYIAYNNKQTNVPENSVKMNAIAPLGEDCQEVEESPPDGNYIAPLEFNVGLMNNKGKPFKSSNLTNDKVIYPYKSLIPDYGSFFPDGCLCDQYIQSP